MFAHVPNFFVARVAFVVGCVHGSQWPIPNHVTMPNVELSLAPPPRPFPEVQAELGSLEKIREKLSHAQMDRLQDTFGQALHEATIRIGEAVGRAMRAFDDPALMKALARAGSASSVSRPHFPSVRNSASFLNLQAEPDVLAEKLSVRVNVIPSAPLDVVVKTHIDSIESHRTGAERDFFEQAHAEMQGLSDLVLSELEAQIVSHVDALLGRGGVAVQAPHATGFADVFHDRAGTIPKQAHVRIVASEVPYPTVSSLVQDLETRRDIGEHLERAQIMRLQLELLKAENAVAKDALSLAVARVAAQFASLSQRVSK